MKNLRMSVRTINPKEASSIVGNHTNYRNPSKKRVEAYSRLMKNMKWGISIIVFDEDGQLMDGQNRLMSVVSSGRQQKFICITGWPKDQAIYLDNNQNRTKTQAAIAELGLNTYTNAKMAVAVGIETMCITERTILNFEALELYTLREDLIDAIVERQSAPLGAAIHGIAFARAIIAHPKSRNVLLEAIENMCYLNFAEDNMSGLRLYYQWFVIRGGVYTSDGGSARKNTYLRLCRAIQAFLNNQIIDKLYACVDDPFPLKEGKQ